jgi:hypothetical protein
MGCQPVGEAWNESEEMKRAGSIVRTLLVSVYTGKDKVRTLLVTAQPPFRLGRGLEHWLGQLHALSANLQEEM